jgi:uncharacterized protein YecE (DUF72 family)
MTVALRFFIGTSGWSYPSWKPGFYPDGTSAKRFLGYYASKLTSVEVNHTFGSVLKPGQLEGWLDQAGLGFRFSFKAPQRITHFNRLRESHAEVEAFFDSLQPAADAGMLGLVLFQLPPNFKADLPRLRGFLAAPAFRTKSAPPIAFEFRHDSWFTEDTYTLLHEQNAALCIAETDDLTTPEVHTAIGHTCFRLRRAGGYTPKQIARFADRFRMLAKDRDVYAYFRHEDEPTGALNAAALLRKAA